jgi:predicted nucleic acid-binding protein
MPAVSDTSPLYALSRIGFVDVLAPLFGTIVIPPQVVDELSHVRTPREAREVVSVPRPWLVVQTPQQVECIQGLHPGEEAAIALARELRTGMLLIDDRDGRRAAVGRGLTVIGTVGLLERAADQDLLDLGTAFDRLKATDFRIPLKLLDERLRLHRERHR